MVKVTGEVLHQQALKAVSFQKMHELIDEIVELVVTKNSDYGDAWQRYGIFTPLIRINDKILRLKTLSTGRQALVAEVEEDTLRDIIGYALLALLWMEDNNEYKPDKNSGVSAGIRNSDSTDDKSIDAPTVSTRWWKELH